MSASTGKVVAMGLKKRPAPGTNVRLTGVFLRNLEIVGAKPKAEDYP